MKRLIILVVSLLVLSVTNVRAEDQSPVVPSAQDIFTNAVEVVQTLPVISFDDDNHTLYFLDAEATAWKTYPYPSDFIDSHDYTLLADGTFLLGFAANDAYYTTFAEPVKGRIFDPQTGLFTMPATHCGWFLLPNQPETWVFFKQSASMPYQLCSLKTGALTPPLPASVQNKIEDYLPANDTPRPPSLSPDGKWFVFFSADPYPNFKAYTYEIATGKLNYLGESQEANGESIYVERWIDNTHPLIYSAFTSTYSWRTLFIADVTRPQSLMLLIGKEGHGNITMERYFDDPPHIEWVPAQDQVQPVVKPEDCQIHSLDFKTLEVSLLPSLDNVCGLGVTIPDGSRDRLSRDLFNTGQTVASLSAQLIRFNPYTPTSEVVRTAKTEWVESFSKAGRYVVLMEDDREYLPSDENLANPIGDRLGGLEHPRWSILDLKTNEVVYTVTPLSFVDLAGPSGSILYPYPLWVTDTTLLLLDKPCDGCLTSLNLVTLGDAPIIEKPLVQAREVLTEWDMPIVVSVGDLNGIHLETFASRSDNMISLTKQMSPTQYGFYITAREDSSWLVTLIDQQHSHGYENPFILRQWIVRLKE